MIVDLSTQDMLIESIKEDRIELRVYKGCDLDHYLSSTPSNTSNKMPHETVKILYGSLAAASGMIIALLVKWSVSPIFITLAVITLLIICTLIAAKATHLSLKTSERSGLGTKIVHLVANESPLSTLIDDEYAPLKQAKEELIAHSKNAPDFARHISYQRKTYQRENPHRIGYEEDRAQMTKAYQEERRQFESYTIQYKQSLQDIQRRIDQLEKSTLAYKRSIIASDDEAPAYIRNMYLRRFDSIVIEAVKQILLTETSIMHLGNISDEARSKITAREKGLKDELHTDIATVLEDYAREKEVASQLPSFMPTAEVYANQSDFQEATKNAQQDMIDTTALQIVDKVLIPSPSTTPTTPKGA